MGDITDLDVLVPPRKKVMLAGHTYVLPGDMPLETYLKVNGLSDRQADGAKVSELVTDTVDTLIDLFTREPQDPAPNVEELRRVLLSLSFDTVMQILGKVYPTDDDDEADEPVVAEEAGPPTSSDGETTTTTS